MSTSRVVGLWTPTIIFSSRSTMIFSMISRSIDRFNSLIGASVAWLVLAMVLTQLAVVILRYVFSYGSIALQESVWYMHGLIFMLGAGATYLANDHVRIDVFYGPASRRKKAWIDLCGIILFLLPVCGAILYLSFGYVTNAWAIREGSIELTGLPYIFLLKTVIWLFAIVVGLQAISQAIKACEVIVGGEPQETE